MSDPLQLLWIDTGYACAGVVCAAGRVVEAAPIYRWMIGKRFSDVVAGFRRRGRRLNVADCAAAGCDPVGGPCDHRVTRVLRGGDQ